MKKIINLFIGLMMASSCTPSTPVQEQHVNKIMPLGASRVQGNPPFYYSYRHVLWKSLTDDGYPIDFVGNEVDDFNYGPNFSNFDSDHEGHSGWTSGEILEELGQNLLSIDTPDVVLFSSPGGNDALDGLSYSSAMANVNAIIDTLQNHNPEVTILIELMAPGHSMVMIGDLKTYFDYLATDIPALATAKTTATSSVIVVNMSSGFADSLLADPIHYNLDGATFIADRYYQALKDILEE